MASRTPAGGQDDPRRVGIIGHGSIGRVIAAALDSGSVPGWQLGGVLMRRGSESPALVRTLDALLRRSDLVIEAAGHEAVAHLGPQVVAAGADLMVISVGALADSPTLERLKAGPGRLLISTGALGGLDILRAAMMCGRFDEVSLHSRKPAGAIMREWMDPGMRAALRDEASGDLDVFDGPAREAARLFPQTSNVSATLALATIGLDETRVRLTASRRVGSQHVVTARGPSGEYEIRIANVAAPGNARTSLVTAFSAMRALSDMQSTQVIV